MPRIEISTLIRAPAERCFWLALSVDAHAASARHTGEQVVGGRLRGLLQLGDSVTFRARHFGVWQTLTSRVTDLQAPTYFRDQMQRGAFARLEHAHYFEATAAGTRMRDVLDYAAPLGPLGRLAEQLVLTRYLRRFLRRRAAELQQLAEGEGWRQFLPVG